MKMSGKQFKSLIKECLKELIQEGHFQQMMMESMKQVSMPSNPQIMPPQNGFPQPHYNQMMHGHPAAGAISTLASNMAKGNPNQMSALYEIFSDTAANHPHVLGDRHAQHMGVLQQGMHQSYQENYQQPHMLQEQQEMPTPVAPPRQEGQFASRWAELAFSKSQRPR
jgi:hypothetical protein